MATANGDLDIHLSDSCAPLRPVQWQTGLSLDNRRLIYRHPDHQGSQALPWPFSGKDD
ncbi:hypothetical protein [Ferrimonas sp. YFM]|uniref:hypothetical protein n=1 Tax=Ferrimonas sp. YFM TaxID=3028878 RepID=UPI002572FC68|nr:hypothetical protein [Ferrimonas sp. YFM]BDY03700.1 hypothetical protein F0521_07410 [Ferrimonas sp. YFM]